MWPYKKYLSKKVNIISCRKDFGLVYQILPVQMFLMDS